MSDWPISRRQIDYTGWDLVFTGEGRYYFYDTVEGHSKWNPPELLLEYLLDLPEEQRVILFDINQEYILLGGDMDEEFAMEEMDFIEEDEKDLQVEEDVPPIITPIPTVLRSVKPKVSVEERESNISLFKELLLERDDIDPFKPWSEISSALSTDQRFHSIPNEKERKAIFDTLCPLLASKARQKKELIVEEASQQWHQTLQNLLLATAQGTWAEYSRTCRKESWYRLLDHKILEKEYRARIKELRDRSIVFQIPK